MQANRFALLAGVALTGCLVAQAGHAQTATPMADAIPANAPASTAIAPSDEIVVTANRRNENLINVPMTVNVVTGQDLKKLNLFDVKDIQQLAPGLELTNDVGRNNVATLRGITFDPDSGTSPAVDVYYNEIPVNAQTAFTAIYDIGQIEVLHGPQGSLRGRTSPAGAITIASRKPDLNDTNGYAQLTGTDRNAQNLQGAVSIPIVDDKLAIRAAMLIDHNRLNQVYDVNNGRRSRSNTESARLSIAWKPVETVRVDLSYQYLNADNYQFAQAIGPGNQPSLFSPELSGPPATIKDRIATGEGLQRFQNNSHLLTGSVSWDINDTNTLSFLGGYQHAVLDQRQDLDPQNAVPGYVQEQHTVSPYISKTAELRLESHRSGFWNYSLDAFYTKQSGTTVVHQPNNVFFGDTTFNTPYPYSFGLNLPIDVDVIVPSNSQTFAIAGSNRFQFTDKLKLEVAARYTWYRNVNSTFLGTSSTGAPALGIPAFDSAPTETILPENRLKKPKALTGSATLTYTITPDAVAYVNYGRSYRPGSVQFASVPVDNSLLVTKNETSNAIEVGFKTSFFDRKVSFNVDGFYQKFHNYIGRTVQAVYILGNIDPNTGLRSPTSTQINFNGNAEIKGVEATLSGRPTRDLDLGISVSYVKARYKNALAPCDDFNGDGIPNSDGAPVVTGSGNVSFCRLNSRLADVPNFHLTSNGEYRFHTGDYTPFVRYLFSYTPKVFSYTSDYTFRDRENLNLYVGVQGPRDRWELTAFVKNVLNQQRITTYGTGAIGTSTFTGGNGPSFFPGYAGVNVTVPREFGGTLSFNF
jgi:iron complex outermembrane receptor protein